MRLPVLDVESLAKSALIAAGCEAHAAACVAHALVRAQAQGVPSCGLFYLPIFCRHLRIGKVHGNARATAVRCGAGVLRIDAQHGFAHPAMDMAVTGLEKIARENGVAIASIANSYNALALGQPMEDLARRGLVGLACANAPASLAVPGSAMPFFGTNPIAFAAPVAGADPIVVDQSSSAVTKTELRLRAAAGESIPEGWAQDVDGKPTQDPALGLAGSMLPSGGQKGANIALLVEILSAVLTGAVSSVAASSFGSDEGGPPGTGQFLMALDPSAFAGRSFAKHMDSLVSGYFAAGLRLPGARRHENLRVSYRDGLEVSGSLLAEMNLLAAATK